MKYSRILGVVLLVVGILSALWLRPAQVDCGGSDIYAMEEREAVADMIVAQVRSWEGYRLYSVIYGGDEVSARELEYCQELDDGIDACMVFYVQFRSPIFNSGAMEPHNLYQWTWYMGRSGDGTWAPVAFGAG